MDATMVGLQKEIVDVIKGFVAESERNRLAIDGSRIFDEPLVGFADGDDPLFLEYKKAVDGSHFTPREAMQLHLAEVGGGEKPVSPLTVVSFVLPITEETRVSNAKMTVGPSVRWNQTRWYGEELITSLKNFLVGFLEDRGYRALSPSLKPFFKTLLLSNGRASNWSERHMAYAAGLGTFGLTDALITPKGVAHRLGSVVVEAALPASPRPYSDHHAYCPFYDDGSCGVCIERCPHGALSSDGHDKIRCRDYNESELKPWVAERASEGYLGKYPGCGLCMTGVPCEAAIPPGVKMG